ncbi:hypothetical protein MLD38_016970 [Melastoma candidum]|uniref:Uncharacterized protein n=1 Tax=Melastoma candidum TaxID=119954 RepID=A0ACB9QNH8_9MYRT|nr:hypothetical protein MLD38_016970 [Melastoma candidum]
MGNGGRSPQQQTPAGSHPPACACPPLHDGTGGGTTVYSSDEVVTSSGSETRSWDDFAGILEEWDAVAVHFTEEVLPSVPWWHPGQIQEVRRQQTDITTRC